MKIRYICEYCNQTVAELDNAQLEKLGINDLTDEEKADIIKYDGENGLIVNTICDDCIGDWGFDNLDIQFRFPKSIIH